MGKRILSAAVGVPLLVAAVVAGSLPFASVVALAAGVGAAEFYGLARQGGAQPLARLGIPFAALLALAPALPHSFAPNLGLWVGAVVGWVPPLVVLLSLIALLLRRDRSQAAADWAWTVAGIFYPGLLLSYWVGLRLADPGGYLVLVGLFTTFAADTFAYFAGRLWGRHPLAPQISPGKTWEGVAAGWVGAVATSLLLAAWLVPHILAPLPAAVLGGLVGVVGPVGDLAESLLKRSVGAKDAGAIIPGHGGVLDRLDSLLFTGPVIYFYVSLLIIRGL